MLGISYEGLVIRSGSWALKVPEIQTPAFTTGKAGRVTVQRNE